MYTNPKDEQDGIDEANLIDKKNLEIDSLDIEEKRELSRELYNTLTIEEISDELEVGEWAVKKWVNNEQSLPETDRLSLKIKKLANNPGLIKNTFTRGNLLDINRMYFDIRNSTSFNDSGVDIFDQDWDNLIVLDACRFDRFVDLQSFSGTHTRKKSKASMTHEWLDANFSGKRLSDLVYVDSNGNYFNYRDELNARVYKYVPLWEKKHRKTAKSRTTPPEVVTDRAIEVNKRHPNKRLLIHYIQPHRPYIGSIAENMDFMPRTVDDCREHQISSKNLYGLYNQTLSITLDEVDRLLPELSGKTVITSDHGELLREKTGPLPVTVFGHPPGIYTPELVDIPWYVHNYNSRKKIIDESVEEFGVSEDRDVREHLENLGYRV